MGKLTTCCRLVGDTANYLNMSRQFAMSRTSPQVILMEFGKQHDRHNGLFPTPTCYGLATGKLE